MPGNLFAPQADPADQTGNYNTPLSPREEAAFQQWVRKNGRARDLYDYDLRGAWKKAAQQAGNGHLPDDWKKPNHPTFSNESIYSGPQTPGGTWAGGQGGAPWLFAPSPQNLKYQNAGDLQNYFRQREAGNQVILPANIFAGRR